MKIKNLHHILSGYLKEFGELEIEILSKRPEGSPARVAYSSATKVVAVGFGIDWDSGRFFIHPAETLQEIK